MGSTDSVTGLARPPSGVARIEAGQLQPARLEVSFARLAALDGRRLGRLLGGGSGPDGRYAIVSEASREYLWVLSRQPALTLQDEALIRSRLTTLGFDLARVQPHRHNPR